MKPYSRKMAHARKIGYNIARERGIHFRNIPSARVLVDCLWGPNPSRNKAEIRSYLCRLLGQRGQEEIRKHGRFWQPPTEPLPANPTTRSFYTTKVWKELRYKAIVQYGRTCMACGSTDGPIQVDHIKPRSLHPDLALELDNLQILCADCNIGKSNLDDTDFRVEGVSQ